MKKLRFILSPLIFLMTFACVNDEPDVIVQDENLNKFLNSSFYSSLNKQGFEMNEDEIEFKEVGNRLAFVVPIRQFPSTMRVSSAYSEILFFTKDFSDKNSESLILGHENLPSENYSGAINISSSVNNELIMTMFFENGELKSTGGLNERIVNNMTCTGPRSILACVGYRVENYNIAESVFFFGSFGAGFAAEYLSCWEDGCPYE